jgi:hypothetical protein
VEYWSDGVSTLHHSNIPLLRRSLLCPRAIGLKFSEVFFRPAAKRVQWFNQGSAQPREGVLYFRRHNRMDDALYQTVALETAQRLCQHFLRNTSDLALQGGITHRSARQNLDNESRPFIGNSVEHEPGRTLRIQNGRVGGHLSHASV